ncbi:uncharacterized protein LOC115633729 [Scaptodrosophila lebanonensis]|uniref:Uncharacterized protein LOC115633729 n=1 Tax=Drosophila lebanonensis TaxID=7225 RepID=A0A6J2UIL9_DROLE|nr:uncharacterized protein LOC115633729 [Scaptodrosophila lebanonensis]XP_030387058.1 uncharacterized protein LOC115633729 [Scaptodrosophila lebanonensis]
MDKRYLNCLLILCCGIMLLQPESCHALRIKRTPTQVSPSTATDAVVAPEGNELSKSSTNSPLAKVELVKATSVLMAKSPYAAASNTGNSESIKSFKDSVQPSSQGKSVAATATSGVSVVPAAIGLSATSATSAPNTLAANAPKALSPAEPQQSPPFAPKIDVAEEALLDAGSLIDLSRMHRSKRRMSFIDDSLPALAQLPIFAPSRIQRRRRHHAAAPAAPPYMYYNKMMSPDGKHELKEFELVAPNMMIESMQQELNYGPELMSLPLPLTLAAQDLGGVLVVNADKGFIEPSHAHAHAARHHAKHKAPGASTALATPMLYMLQQLLQQPLEALPMAETSNDLDGDKQTPLGDSKSSHRHQDTPLYQFIDHAVDMALRNNHETIEHLLMDGPADKQQGKEQSEMSKGQHKDIKKKKELETLKSKSKEAAEPTNNEDALVVSCPIHHEHHTDKNGGVVDDDIVVVNECHIV